MALGFLLLRTMRRDVRESPGIRNGIQQNAWLLVFCVYAAVSAFILPRIFAGRVNVIPMQKAIGFMPLVPSSQNITQSVYVTLTGLAAIAASAVAIRPGAAKVIVKAAVVITWVQVVTGVVDAAASAVHVDGIFDLVRNGAYAQLDQDAGTFHRISGLTPEASSYAGLGTVFLVFMSELWLRDVWRRRTGLAAIFMLLLLLASTSSTAYLAVAGYAVVLALRAVVAPGSLSITKSAVLLSLTGGFAAIACTLALLNPGIVASIGDVVAEMTVNKSQSLSGMERGLWARQGWDLFLQTRGLGVGVGSFRSSSLFTAILGSVGPACLAIFLGYCLQVLKPLRRSTYVRSETLETNVGAAAAWTAVVQLIPASIGAAGADPGILFAAFAALSLALRAQAFPAVVPRFVVPRTATRGRDLQVPAVPPSASTRL